MGSPWDGATPDRPRAEVELRVGGLPQGSPPVFIQNRRKDRNGTFVLGRKNFTGQRKWEEARKGGAGRGRQEEEERGRRGEVTRNQGKGGGGKKPRWGGHRHSALGRAPRWGGHGWAEEAREVESLEASGGLHRRVIERTRRGVVKALSCEAVGGRGLAGARPTLSSGEKRQPTGGDFRVRNPVPQSASTRA